MRAGCAFPKAGANKNLAVALAFFAMKFVNRHGNKIIGVAKSSSAETSIKKAGIQERTNPAFLIQDLLVQGDNFSRCGKWSRFQRTKAASLVSSKRNCSVGDSTWLAQRSALALLTPGKSSRGLEHSKTLRARLSRGYSRQRLGLRRPSAALALR